MKESIDLSSIKEVKKITLEEGDVLILETDSYLQDKAYNYICNKVEDMFPGTKCIILEKIRAKAILKKDEKL